MGTFQYSDSRVIINNREFDIETFNILFPKFSVANNILKIFYEQDKTRFVSHKGGNSTLSIPWEEGDEYISNLSNLIYIEEQDKIDSEESKKQIESIKFKNLSYDEKRKSEYPSVDELVVAMWEAMIEKKSHLTDDINRIEEKRVSVKNKYPK